MKNYEHLTPRRIGVELCDINPRVGVMARPGTGFDPDNPQHWEGSDAVRYAIALQQLRDDEDFPVLDSARSLVQVFGYFVMQTKDGTIVKARPLDYYLMRNKARKAFRVDSYDMPVVDGVIFDAA